MFELAAWLELELVGTAASIPLWLCVLAAVVVTLVCVALVVGGEEEVDVSQRRSASRPRAGQEERAQRAAVALRVLLREIDNEDDRRDVEHAARVALIRSQVIEADE